MLTHILSFPLRYADDCLWMGITSQALYIEEFYGDTLEFVAQTQYDVMGNLLATADEAYGQRVFKPLQLPPYVAKSRQNPPHHPLNYTGARRRGLREPEHLQDWVQPLSIMEKMTLIDTLKLAILPPQLAGIAESYVLAEADLNAHVSLVCRVVRLAILMPHIAQDADGLPYDYDTLPLYVAQLIAPHDDAPSLLTGLHDFYGVRLNRPQDCLVYDNTLWIADGGNAKTGQRSQVHGWRLG